MTMKADIHRFVKFFRKINNDLDIKSKKLDRRWYNLPMLF